MSDGNAETGSTESAASQSAATAPAAAPAGVRSERRGLTKVGVVTSNKMDKTVAVRVDRLKAHEVYRRTVRLSKKFLAHDPDNRCQVGDRVEIIESRPLSRRKRWRVTRVLGKAE